MAAVVVSGLVGLSAPVITWRVAVSSQRAASEDDRTRADLQDLRTVLDSAIDDLEHLRTAMGREMVAWQDRAPREEYEQRHAAVAQAYAAASTDLNRIELRVGRASPLWRTYSSAIGESFDASLYTYGHPFNPEAGKVYASRANDGNTAAREFREHALRLAGAQLPDAG